MNELSTAAAREQAHAQYATKPILELLTLTSIERPEPVRIVHNRLPIMSRGNLFEAWWFDLAMPSDDDQAPSAQITVANTSRRIGEELERILTPPEALIEIVLASTPDTVERSWEEFQLTQAAWDAFRVTGVLQQPDYWDEPCPGVFVTPALFPCVAK